MEQVPENAEFGVYRRMMEGLKQSYAAIYSQMMETRINYGELFEGDVTTTRVPGAGTPEAGVVGAEEEVTTPGAEPTMSPEEMKALKEILGEI
jgi:hypothetical protein